MNKKIRIPDPLKKFVIQDIDKLFVKKDCIAKGAQGTIWLAVDNQKKQYAIKEILVDLNNPNWQVKRYLQECASLMRAKHPFIVSFVGMTEMYPFQMITEYIGPVNLTTFLTNRHFKSQSNNGTHLTKIAVAISNAMMFLHKINIIHRDLKPSNILIGNDFLPRICDFGLVHEINEKDLMTAGLGTPIWMAPEVIRGESYSNKCDVFSFAMILYQMATKTLPLAELSTSVIMEKYKNELYRPTFPQKLKIPEPLQNLIISCWSENPNERPSFQQIFDKFASGDVTFSYCNTNLIKEFANHLIKDDQNRSIIPPFEVFSYKTKDDNIHPKADDNKNSKNDTNSVEKNDENKKKKEIKNDSDVDSKSDTDSSYHQNKKKKKDENESYSSDDNNNSTKNRKKKKKIIKKRVKSDESNKDSNSDDDNLMKNRKKKIIKKRAESDESSKDSNSDDDDNHMKNRKKKKKIIKKRVESDESNKDGYSDEYDNRTRNRKKKIIKKRAKSDEYSNDSYSDDYEDDNRMKNRKKKNKIIKKRAESDESSDIYHRVKKKSNRNNSSKSDTTYKKQIKRKKLRYSDDIIDDKNEPIFEVDTFATEQKNKRKTTSTIHRLSSPKKSNLNTNYSDYSDKPKKAPQMPQFRTHTTNDRKRKPAPDLKFSEPSTSQTYSSESSHDYKRKKSDNSKFYPIDSPRFTSNLPVSMETLSDVHNPMFRIELEKVKKRDFSKFLKVLKNHLTSMTPHQELVLLLRKTNDLLDDDDCLSLFSEKKVFEFLPIMAENNRNGKNKKNAKKYQNDSESYSEENIITNHDELLDISIEILNKVCQFYPQFIDEDFETSLLSLINLRPIESAKFLRLYSSSFDMIENPWPILDMLIVHKKKFNKTEAGSILIKTLVYLIRNHKNYKKNRLNNCRAVITYFLNSPVKKNVVSAYKAVSVLYDNKFDLPFKKIRIDMEDPDLVNSVISLFDKMEDIPSAKSIIFSLVKIAHKNEKASDVLIKMAKDYDSALILINSQEKWMYEKLPTFEATLRIFIAATSDFRDLRKIVVSDSIHVAALFSCLSKFEKNEDSFLCFEKVFNQIHFNYEFLENLQEKRFFTNFFRGIIEIENNKVTLSCLRALKSMIEIDICDEFFNFSKNLRKFASRNDKIGIVAQDCIDMMSYSKRKKESRKKYS